MLGFLPMFVIASLFFAGSCAFALYLYREAKDAARSSPVHRLLQAAASPTKTRRHRADS